MLCGDVRCAFLLLLARLANADMMLASVMVSLSKLNTNSFFGRHFPPPPCSFAFSLQIEDDDDTYTYTYAHIGETEGPSLKIQERLAFGEDVNQKVAVSILTPPPPRRSFHLSRARRRQRRQEGS